MAKKENRPGLDLPLLPIEVRLDYFSFGLVLAMMVASLWSFSVLPEQIPIHWNIKGEPDSFGTTYWIFVIPIISLVFHFGLVKICDYPHTFNYLTEITADNAATEYIKGRKIIRFVNVASQVIFTIIVFVTIRGAMGGSDSLGVWFVPTILLLSFLPLVYAIWDKKI